MGMAYKNHFYNFICVNWETSVRGVEIFTAVKIFSTSKWLHSFIRQIIFLVGGALRNGPVPASTFWHSVNQSVNHPRTAQICIRVRKQTNNPNKPHYYDCRLWLCNDNSNWEQRTPALGFYRNLIKPDTHMDFLLPLLNRLFIAHTHNRVLLYGASVTNNELINRADSIRFVVMSLCDLNISIDLSPAIRFYGQSQSLIEYIFQFGSWHLMDCTISRACSDWYISIW